MQIVADAVEDFAPEAPADVPALAADVPADAPSAPAGTPGRFHTLITLEGVETGDGRMFVEGALEWRDLPLPLMGTDKTTEGHLDAVLIGNIDTIERQGTELHGWGEYLSDPDAEAAKLIAMVEAGELRGVSGDIDNVEFEILIPADPEPPEDAPPAAPQTDEEMMAELFGAPDLPRETLDGQDYLVMAVPQEKMRVTQGRIMGATVVPFQAFMEAYIEPAPAVPVASDESVVASGAGLSLGATRTDGPREARPAHFNFPAIPPASWFDVPEPDGPMPLTILDSGQVFGHLALWGQCHIGISGECVEAPPSPSNYARFHLGETPTDDHGRVATGTLTFHTGHASGHLGPDATRAHYDHSGTAGADVVAKDGVYGIWVCGAARSNLTDAAVREMMAAPPSGDWRRFGRDMDMVAALCVNVPGYEVPRRSLAASAAWVRVNQSDGLMNSLIVVRPASTATHLVASGAADFDPALAHRVIDRIAASIGRSQSQRILALRDRVHGAR